MAITLSESDIYIYRGVCKMIPLLILIATRVELLGVGINRSGRVWRRSGSAVESRTLDRGNTVTNPPHIGAVDGDSLWRCYATTKQNHCTCTVQ